MKLTLFALTLLFFTACQPSESADASRPAAVEAPLHEFELFWQEEGEALDSTDTCNMPDGRTRYFSSYFFRLEVGYPDSLAGDGVHLALSCEVKTMAPGQLCAGGTPYALQAVDDSGDTLEVSFVPESCPQTKEASTDVCGELTIELPLRTGHTTARGGICIILETIDPLTRFYPELTSLTDWEASLADVTYPIVASESQGLSTGPIILAPAPPECTDCTYED